MPRSMTVEQKFARHTKRAPNGCLLWTAGKFSSGYGIITINAWPYRTHRVAWEMANGRPVPDGLHVCHSCNVKNCVEPSHLYVATSRQNKLDAMRDKLCRHSRLRREDIERIRTHGEPLKVVSAALGITAEYAGQIRNGREITYIK